MDDTIDLLKIKIEKAKARLSDDTLNAIAAVPWQTIILGMRETKGYSFEQIGDLETETELLLCGLISSKEYPKELENRMRLSKAQVDVLVQEMNNLVFSKIKEELIKNTEQEKMFEGMPRSVFQTKASPNPKSTPVKTSSDKGIFTKPDPTILELEVGNKEEKSVVHPILAQKMTSSFQIPSVKTEHSLENITKTNVSIPPDTKTKNGGIDPYREIPE